MSNSVHTKRRAQVKEKPTVLTSTIETAPLTPAMPAGDAAAASSTPANPTAGKTKQPSIATLMMLKKRISDLRARHKRNRPVKRVENSYQLGPDPSRKYSVPDVKLILDNSLKFFLAESRYDPKASPKLAKMVSEDVKRRMKNNFNCPRYKIVVMVTVTQRAQQHLMMASRSVADSESDDFVTSTLERPTFVACASAFWFYCE